MDIICDTREHKAEYERIKKQLEKLGHKCFRSKLFVGDYQSLDNARLVVDRKKDLQEVCGNVTQQHERFRNELLRAEDAGIRIIILVEHGEGVKSLTDVYFWENPRRAITKIAKVDGKLRKVKKYPKAISGDKLYKTLETISRRYNVSFEFCEKENTGRRIAELLGGGRVDG